MTGLSLILLHGFALAFMYTRDKYILQSSRRHFACEVVHTNGDSLTSNREGFVPRLVNHHPIKAWNQKVHLARHIETQQNFIRRRTHGILKAEFTHAQL